MILYGEPLSPHPALPPPVHALQGDQSDITRNVDTWKDTRDTEKRRLEVLKAPSSWARMLRTLSRKAPSQPWYLTVLTFLRMQLVSRARESFFLICSSWDQREEEKRGRGKSGIFLLCNRRKPPPRPPHTSLLPTAMHQCRAQDLQASCPLPAWSVPSSKCQT